MDPGLIWRTVRHLSAEQWAFRLVCRGKRAVMAAAPGSAARRLAAAATQLPLPDPAAPRLRDAAEFVLRQQQTVHGAYLDGIAAGRFTLLNREFDFGAPDRIDWRGALDEGNNPLRRMTLAYMGYAVPLLATGGGDGLALTREILRSLVAGNPFSAPGVFRDVWNAYTASHRLINLLCGLSLRRAAGGQGCEAEREIVEHVRLCAAFVRSNLERDLQYNHLLKNFVALSVYGCATPSLPAAFAFLRNAVPRVLGRNVLPDGGHAERSPMYHALGLIDVGILRATGLFGDEFAGVEARMKTALAVMSHPDGGIALFNDGWLGEATPGSEAPPEGNVRLPDTGYVRIGQGGDAVILDCGPCGPDDNPGHAHADFLSIEASAGGRRLLVDPGVPTYTAGALRDLSRSAGSHNGPHVAGAEPIEFWKSFRVGRRGRAYAIADPALAGAAPLWCAGWQDGYAQLGIEVRRYVGLWPGRALLICDLWRGAGDRPVLSRFLVPAAWTYGDEFIQESLSVWPQALLGTLSPVTADRWWPRFGVETPAHGFTLAPERRDGVHAAALLMSWGDPPAVDAGALANRLAEAPR